MKRILIILMLLSSIYGFSQADKFFSSIPEMATVLDTQQILTSNSGVWNKFTAATLRNTIGAKVTASAIGYVPTLTGNTLNLNEFVTDTAGDVWFIDVDGEAIKLNVGIGSAFSLTDTVTQTAHGFSLLQPLSTLSSAYIGADTTNFTIGIVSEVIDVNNLIITYSGKITATAHGKTIDSIYYTPNAIGQAVLGSSVTSISQPAYKVIDANIVLVQIFRPASLAILSKLTPEEVETYYNQQVSTVTQVEAEAGTATIIRTWTAERVKQAIIALAGGDMTKAVFDPTTVNGDVFDMDNMVEGVTNKILTTAERAAIIANTAKVTNATHTGEVTGATALTLVPTAISNKTLVTADNADHVLIEDATDGLLKKVLVSDFGGSGLGDVTAAANLGDNLLVRGDGAIKGVQNSNISIDDSDNITGVNDITTTGIITTGDEMIFGRRSSYTTGLGNSSIYTTQSGGTGQEFSIVGNLMFQTRSDGGADGYGFYWASGLTASTKMHLTNVGNLGINQLTPTEKLDIVGNIKVSGTAEIIGGFADELAVSGQTNPTIKIFDSHPTVIDGDELGKIDFWQNDGNVGGQTVLAKIQTRSHRDGSGTAPIQGVVGEGGELVFSTGKVAVANAGAVLSEKMIITKDGDVGVGILVPTEKLDVVGNMAISGTVDGYDISVMGVKLAGIPPNASFDQGLSSVLFTGDGGGGEVDNIGVATATNSAPTLQQVIDSISVSNPHGTIYFSASALTTLGVATPAKAAGTTASQGNAHNFTRSTTNRLTYVGTPTVDFHANVSVSISASAATQGKILIYKNGAPVLGAFVFRDIPNTDIGVMSIIGDIELSTNDYIELWIETDDGDDLTIEAGVISIIKI